MADLVVPKLGESISEAVISKWLKNVGEATAADEPVVDLETDKVSIALPAPAAGVLKEQKFAVGATVKVGEIIGTIEVGAAATAVKKEKPAPEQKPEPEKKPEKKKEEPAVAKMPHTPDQSTIPRSQTLPPSVRKAIREGASPVRAVESMPQQRPEQLPPYEPREDEEVVPMSPLRKRIAERLVQAQHTAAILTTFNEVDMTNVMALRARHQDDFVKKHGIKLGFMSIFARAAVESLKDFPGLNAEMRGTEIIYKKHYDLGIAVGGGRGLVVPVVRNIDSMDFAQIEQKIAELAKKAKENTLTLDELSGGTFTVTNGGIYGSMMSTPLLNMPQTGILGMHNIVKRPMVVGDEMKIRPMMYVALSYDHRVVDGREAVQFLVAIKERIENPERLLLSI